MKVLIVGSGGREHALAWKIAQSAQLESLFIAPGNPGTKCVGKNVSIQADDKNGLARFCVEEKIDLAVIGPECSLAAGVADALLEAGVPVFGPSQAAARIETSKAFAKQFMQRHNIPTAQFNIFSEVDQALEYIETMNYPVVIKASGLAAGKGVILPNSREEAKAALVDMLVQHAFGRAGEQVIVEERLQGQEISLLAFCDGGTLACMLPAQDHKPLLDSDFGPNTGGMGAYAPAHICTEEMQEEILRTILQPALDGLRQEGMPFTGVLYAGLILTEDGPKVLEFNARFGDPESQVILPLLKTDLLEVLQACVRDKLHELDLEWNPEAAACVVMASAGYPQKCGPAVEISGLDCVPDDCLVFQAGTNEIDGCVWASGGRVLGITGIAEDLEQAVKCAYESVRKVDFEGAYYRTDIAHAALKKPQSAYRDAGVDIDAGNRAVDLIRDAVKSTYSPHVLAGIGSFGGLYDACCLAPMRNPTLVASTDGVGTKVKLAAKLGRYRGIGMDIVNHCIDDILVQGARPLFFLDYFATSRLKPEILAEIVFGMVEACRAAGCAILGGETAEMPGVYQPDEFDVAGMIVGCVDRDRILPRGSICAGDLLIGLGSVGPHTNGYSLLQKLFHDEDMQALVPGSEVTMADVLLAPHRSYLGLLMPIICREDSPVKGLAHLTGGSFMENIPRILPDGLGAEIRLGSWPVLPIFNEVQKRGQISTEEMHRVFNMGIGMLAVVNPQDVPAFQSALSEKTWVVGEVVEDIQHCVRLV